MSLKAILTNIYYNPSHPASLGAAKTLFRSAKLVDSKMKYKEVHQWHQSQKTAQLWRSFNSKFSRNPYVTKSYKLCFQLDIMDMSNYQESNRSFRYVLMAIDSFSRFVVAYKQKRKSGPETLLNI